MASTRQRKQNLLTARNIETAKKPGRYSDGNGLYLVVRPGGSRQWAFLYRRDGKLKEMGLGSPAKGVTLAMARGLRDEARAVMARGDDPLEARRQAEQAASDVPRFGAYALALVDRIEEGFSNPKHRQQWRNTLRNLLRPDLGDADRCNRHGGRLGLSDADLAIQTGNRLASAGAYRARLERGQGGRTCARARIRRRGAAISTPPCRSRASSRAAIMRRLPMPICRHSWRTYAPVRRSRRWRSNSRF